MPPPAGGFTVGDGPPGRNRIAPHPETDCPASGYLPGARASSPRWSELARFSTRARCPRPGRPAVSNRPRSHPGFMRNQVLPRFLPMRSVAILRAAPHRPVFAPAGPRLRPTRGRARWGNRRPPPDPPAGHCHEPDFRGPKMTEDAALARARAEFATLRDTIDRLDDAALDLLFRSPARRPPSTRRATCRTSCCARPSTSPAWGRPRRTRSRCASSSCEARRGRRSSSPPSPRATGTRRWRPR